MRFAVTFAALFVLTCPVNADEKAKARAKASAALALAKAAQLAERAPVAMVDDLSSAYAKAKAEGKPIVVWVGCKDDDKCNDYKVVREKLKETIHATTPDYNGSSKRRTILLTPKGNQWEQVLEWDFIPSADDIRKAIPAKQPTAIQPTGFFIGQDCPTGA